MILTSQFPSPISFSPSTFLSLYSNNKHVHMKKVKELPVFSLVCQHLETLSNCFVKQFFAHSAAVATIDLSDFSKQMIRQKLGIYNAKNTDCYHSIILYLNKYQIRSCLTNFLNGLYINTVIRRKNQSDKMLFDICFITI